MPDHARSSDPAVQAQLDRFAQLSPGRDILGLERITALLAALGNPERRLPPTFHVAGTNGKGSTCAFLRGALEAADKTVHVYTSPHLVRFNERIRLAGRLIEDAMLAPLLAEVLDTADAERIGPSFFEATTAAAFLAFSRTAADACVVEVGLGGRLDATNVITPLVCGIAQVGVDHQSFLGETLAEIAGEKAGIVKPGVPLVCLMQLPEALTRIEAVAANAGVSPWLEGRDWQIDPAIEPGLSGAHQVRNANLAAQMLARVPAGQGHDTLKIDPRHIRRGIATTRWPARLQRLGPGPLTERLPGRQVLVDGGHNADAAQAIARTLDGAGSIDLVFGLMRNRRIADVLGPIAPTVRVAHVVPLDGHDHHDPRDIAMFAQAQAMPRHCYPAFSLDEAIDRLAADTGGAPTILICGSLYLAGEALRLNREFPD